MGIRIEEIDNLIENEKLFLSSKILSLWDEGYVKGFYPKTVNIDDPKSVIKILLECSKIKESDNINRIIDMFIKFNIYEKLDVMIYLFDEINDLNIPNLIKDNFSFRDLSNEILKYKLEI